MLQCHLIEKSNLSKTFRLVEQEKILLNWVNTKGLSQGCGMLPLLSCGLIAVHQEMDFCCTFRIVYP